MKKTIVVAVFALSIALLMCSCANLGDASDLSFESDKLTYNGEAYVRFDDYGSVRSNWLPMGELLSDKHIAYDGDRKCKVKLYSADAEGDFLYEPKSDAIWHKETLNLPAKMDFDNVKRIVFISDSGEKNAVQYDNSKSAVLQSCYSSGSVESYGTNFIYTVCLEYENIPAYLLFGTIETDKNNNNIFQCLLSDNQGTIMLSQEQLDSFCAK